MKIKTFPLRFVEKDLDDITRKARSLNMTTYQFIMEAIKKQMGK